MRLLIERSQRSDWLGRRWYKLSIVAEANIVEREIIAQHDLMRVEVWVSSVFLAHENEAVARFENSENTAGWSNAIALRRYKLNREGFAARRASLAESFITVADLLTGIAHEACDVSELLSMEAGLRNGFESLQRRLEILVRFEEKDAVAIEPLGKGGGVPPAKWVTMR